jgi:hypothetical protein
MSWMYGLSLLASSGINAWSASENRKSSESISRLNRDSSEEIARLSRKHSAELQYNQLKFSVLQQRENQEFQRELAELNHERAKEIEAFRAKVSHAINQKNLDFQKWRFEQEKKIQYDILQLQQDFQRELSRLQHQNAVELMRERVRSDKSPIHNQAFDLLENSFAHPLMPLQVLISPPQLNYDPKTGKPYLSGFEDTLAEEIHQFLSQGHALNQEWPVQFLNGNWISNSQGGNAALLSLHSQLKSIHVLVLDTKIPLDKLNFSVGYWFSGDTTFTRRPILSGQSFPDLLYESAKKRALEWEKKREKIKASGKDEAYIKALGKVDEENLQIYFQELAGIAELKQTGVTDLLIRKEYKITEEDYKTFYQYLAVWHCLAIGLYADILFLGNSWENTPLLPSLIPYLLEKYRDNPLLTSEFWQEAISSIVKVYEEIHEAFVERLSDCLTAKEEEIEQMWEDTIFDVYARTALERLKEKNSLDGTGFMQFSARLDHFLIHERLIAELLPSLQTATSVTNRVTEVVEERLLVLNETVKSLEEKIRKVNPHIKSMKTIAKGLRKGATNTKNACIAQVGGEYQSYFSQILSKIETDFIMPPVAGLGENQKENYKKLLEKKFQEYQQEKLDGWKKISAGIVANNYLELTELFSEENKEYDRERQEIKEILEGKDLNIQNQSQLSTYQTGSTPESSLKAIDGNATKKMILAGSAATVGTITAGVGVATAANVYLGTHILLAAGLAVTPIGAALLAVSVVGGGLATWWGRRSEIDKFQKGMQKQLAQEFQKLLEPEQISGIKEAIGNLFVGFESYADQLKDDVESLESSLNNLLESKRSKEVDAQAEAKRLEALKADISAQWETINVKYTEIATAKK